MSCRPCCAVRGSLPVGLGARPVGLQSGNPPDRRSSRPRIPTLVLHSYQGIYGRNYRYGYIAVLFKDTGRGPDQHTGPTHRTPTSTASHTAQHNRELRPTRDRRPDAATSERRRRAQGPAEPAQSHSATSSARATRPAPIGAVASAATTADGNSHTARRRERRWR